MGQVGVPVSGAELAEKAAELVSKVPEPLLENVVEFLTGIVTGDRARAERAATLATTETLFERPR